MQHFENSKERLPDHQKTNFIGYRPTQILVVRKTYSVYSDLMDYRKILYG